MERARIFNKLKKPLHILTAFAVIICTAFAFPLISFADSSFYNGFAYIESFSTGTQGSVYDIGVSSSFSGNIYLTGLYSNSSHTTSIVPFYWAYVNNNLAFVIDSTTSYELTVVYPTFSRSFSIRKTDNYSANNYNIYVVQANVFDYFTSKNSSITVFPSTDSLIDYVNNNFSGSSDVYDFETTVEVPSGSVAYIGIPSSGSLSMSAKTTMPMYTSIGSNTWSNVPQRVKQVSSLPDSTTTFPLAGSAIPNWTKTEPYNWLNQSKSAITSTTSWSGSNGNFLTFYNPVYYMDGSIQASTNTVYLTISGYSSIRIYPLQNDMSITAGSTSTSPTDYDGYWDATITDNGDGTGSVSYNPSEGSNLPPTPTSNQYNTGTSSSIIDYINQINQTLTNFAESFINLLKAPVAHIQQLVQAGSDFVGQLSSLYSWLPAEVYNTLTSAIILCISVGVLKVLL